ncbi:MAG: laccase domain-containing protein [Eggerthellaceae bacterium]|nr:laccase domain-containing protein [Eggerthellaceae bacterium]
MFAELPIPTLATLACDGLRMLTDDDLFSACGVRLAFTERVGGVSEGPYASLNLAAHVLDSQDAVERNRRRLLTAIGVPDAKLVVPNQVHGTDLAYVESNEREYVQLCRDRIAEGTDGIVVGCTDVAAMLCFADCMPVVLVAPGGMFAVVHAGWRGVYGNIAPKALDLLCRKAGVQAKSCNAYMGPYIHAECFEVDAQLAQKFATAFGEGCLADDRHVDLGAAMRTSLMRAGMDPARIEEAGLCTVCNNERFFSYRAQDGVCGRHAAIAVRTER